MKLTVLPGHSIGFEIDGQIYDKYEFFELLFKRDGRSMLQLEKDMGVAHGHLASIHAKSRTKPGLEAILLAILTLGYEVEIL